MGSIHDTTLAAQYPLSILIVEDNPVNSRLAQSMLRRLGYDVDLAWNGREALELAAAGSYDLVLMDIQMPVMDGYEATQCIDAALGCQRPRIVAMTANAMPGDREHCLAAGMDDFIGKPISFDELRRVITACGESLHRGACAAG